MADSVAAAVGSLAVLVLSYLAFAVFRVVPGQWIIYLCLGCTAWIYLSGSRREDARKKRRMSMMTDSLAKGGFPSRLGIPHTVIHGIAWFNNSESPTRAALEELVRRALLTQPGFERFRCAIDTTDPTHSYWLPAIAPEDIDLSQHIVNVDVGNEAELVAYIEKLMMKPFENTDKKPLWEFHLLTNAGEGRSALVPRIHHCIGDGISMLQIITSLFTDEQGQNISFGPFSKRRPRERTGTGRTGRVAYALDTTRNSMNLTVLEGAQKLQDLVLALVTAAGYTVFALYKIVGLSVWGGDSPTVFKDNHTPVRWTGRRRIVFVPPLSLAKIKTIKQASGATVNDVIMSVIAGCLRRYMQHRQDPELSKGSAVQIRVNIPYAFPRTARPGESKLRNAWTFVVAPLPMGDMGPQLRLKQAQRSIELIKKTPEPYLLVLLQRLMAFLPFENRAEVAVDLMNKSTAVFTNVPGPTQQIYLAQCPVQGLDVVLPNFLPQISVLSYNGVVSMSFVVDDQVVTEPHKLADFVVEELASLEQAIDTTTEAKE